MTDRQTSTFRHRPLLLEFHIMANSAERTRSALLTAVDTNDIELSYLSLCLDLLASYYSGGDTITQNYIRETIRRIEVAAAASPRTSGAAVRHVKETLNKLAEQLDRGY